MPQENTENFEESIRDSKFATITYYVSAIPLVGIVLFPFLYLASLFEIGKYGRLGFGLLNRSAIVLLLNLIAFVLAPFYVFLFYPHWSSEDAVHELSYGYKHYGWSLSFKLKKYGVWKTYDNDSGFIVYQQEYRNDLLFGKYIWYHENSYMPRMMAEMKNDLHDGKFNLFYPNGNKKVEMFKTNGKAQGKATWWYENGALLGEEYYDNNIRCGHWQYWHKSHKLLAEGDHIIGKQTKWTWYYESGAKEMEGTIHCDDDFGKMVDKWTRWYPNGNKREEGILKDGYIDLHMEKTSIVDFAKWFLTGPNIYVNPPVLYGKTGPWTTWHENGKMESQGIYSRNSWEKGDYPRDYEDGKWQFWDEAGNLIKEETYDATGRLISTREYGTTNSGK